MIERTFDYRKVKKLCGGYPCISSECIYLIDDEKYLWGFKPYKDGYLISCNDYDPVHGILCKLSVNKAFDWIFKNTKAISIYGQIHKDNKPSRFMAFNSGMEKDFEQKNYIFYKVMKNATNKAA